MAAFIAFTCIVISIISSRMQRSVINPLTIIFVFFSLMIGLASMGLYNLYDVRDDTYIVMIVGLLGFLIGYVVISVVFPKKRNAYLVTENRYEFKYDTLYFLYFVTIVYMLYRGFSVIILLTQGYTLGEVRGAFTSEVLGSSVWAVIYENYVNKAIIFMFIPIAAIDFFAGKKDKRLLILTFIVAVLSAIGDGGRVIFYYVFIHFLIAAIVYKKRLNISKKMKRIILVLLVLGVTAMYIITKMRGPSASIIQQLYLYLAGAIPHLDYRLYIIDSTNSHTNGWAFLSGYLKPFFHVISSIGIINYPQSFLNSLDLMNVDNFVNIGDRITFNAFVTPFFYYYLDGGIIGVFFYSAAYGVICSLSYNYVKYKPNIKNIAIYLLIMQGVLTSMVRWQFVISAYALSFLYLNFVIKKKKDNDNLDEI
ncbi:O-antigen polymerase [Paenibacillus sp. FSL R5-0470]|uniref:O-antigen polymerase n=1 Tax=Paenibacillus sp. FSL R5-0470 TaxID=2921641 RepID=UPI0030DD6F54